MDLFLARDVGKGITSMFVTVKFATRNPGLSLTSNAQGTVLVVQPKSLNSLKFLPVSPGSSRLSSTPSSHTAYVAWTKV